MCGDPEKIFDCINQYKDRMRKGRKNCAAGASTAAPVRVAACGSKGDYTIKGKLGLEIDESDAHQDGGSGDRKIVVKPLVYRQ